MLQSKEGQKKRVINVKDRRVRKTIKALREALIRLLAEKSVKDITVSELTTLADVNRSTFYFYYDDVYDMVQQLQDETYEIFYQTVVKPDSELHGEEAYIGYVIRFFEFCKDNEIQCKFLLNNDINLQLFQRIVFDVRDNIPDSSEEFQKDSPEHYLTTYLISGIIGIIKQWFNDGMQVEPEKMARFIGKVYMKGALSALNLIN